MSDKPEATKPEPEPTIDASGVFKPTDAIAAIERRTTGETTSWRWWEVWQEEHERSFVVAKMASADLLSQVHQSLQKAVAEGQPFEQWKKDIMPVLQDQWIGKTVGELWNELHEEEKAKRKPPSAKQRAQVIEPKRLKTIYRTKVAVAYAAGHYQQQKDMADVFPY